jgi:hypothetical protein
MNLADQESGTLDLKVDRPFSVSSPTSDTVVLVSALNSTMDSSISTSLSKYFSGSYVC